MRYLLLCTLAACATDHGVEYIAGFSPPPVEAGYTRYVTPTIHDLHPGDDEMFCQWVAPPVDHDRQIIDTGGFQSVGGHHVVLYATSEVEAVGTSRICTTRDMLTVNFVGAVGAEGVSSAKLPDGMAFTVPAGFALMTNTHYFNATDNTIDGQSVIDVEYADPSVHLPGASQVAVNNDGFTIPPGGLFTYDAYCTAQATYRFFMWGNHMHEWGAHTMSEVLRAGSSRRDLMAQDDAWTKDKTFNPAWVRWDPSTPFVVNAGDTFHVSCTWNNTTSDPLMFPIEMCVSTGFTLEEMPMAICDGKPM
jgi:hypothetical protein